MDILYRILLSLHSILRWVVLLLALFTIIRSLTGMTRKRPWERMDQQASLWFVSSLDLQFLVGLILYFFLSPITQTALQNFGGAMGNSSVRFFAVEHILMMFIAVVLAHIGRGRAKRLENRVAKHRTILIFTALALLLILVAIPWPFLDPAIARPWIRF